MRRGPGRFCADYSRRYFLRRTTSVRDSRAWPQDRLLYDFTKKGICTSTQNFSHHARRLGKIRFQVLVWPKLTRGNLRRVRVLALTFGRPSSCVALRLKNQSSRSVSGLVCAVRASSPVRRRAARNGGLVPAPLRSKNEPVHVRLFSRPPACRHVALKHCPAGRLRRAACSSSPLGPPPKVPAPLSGAILPRSAPTSLRATAFLNAPPRPAGRLLMSSLRETELERRRSRCSLVGLGVEERAGRLRSGPRAVARGGFVGRSRVPACSRSRPLPPRGPARCAAPPCPLPRRP